MQIKFNKANICHINFTFQTISKDIFESRNIAPAIDSKISPNAFGTSTSSASSHSSSDMR